MNQMVHILLAVTAVIAGIWLNIDPGALGLVCGVVLGHGIRAEAEQ